MVCPRYPTCLCVDHNTSACTCTQPFMHLAMSHCDIHRRVISPNIPENLKLSQDRFSAADACELDVTEDLVKSKNLTLV